MHLYYDFIHVLATTFLFYNTYVLCPTKLYFHSTYVFSFTFSPEMSEVIFRFEATQPYGTEKMAVPCDIVVAVLHLSWKTSLQMTHYFSFDITQFVYVGGG